MSNALQIVGCLVILALFVWLMIPTAKTLPKGSDASGDPFIDPDDARQIGMLAGLSGGSIPDAATMRFALQRFQEVHGRRATTRDIGVVLGLIRSTH